MKGSWVSAAEAARRLGVKRETLYAYVSRGLIRSAAKGATTRERVYAREDIERARRRAEDRRDPSAIATHALRLGSPVLESGITLIQDGRLYYRGFNAVELSRGRSIREVASLIWRGRFDAWPERRAPAVQPRAPRTLPFLATAQTVLAAAASHDSAAFDLRADAVAATGARILDLMVLAASGIGSGPDDEPIELRLAEGWKLQRRAGELLRAAIILCADHELNVSAFTARCVASAAASPWDVVSAGLAALKGARHGGHTARVEALFREAAAGGMGMDARQILAGRLRRGEEIPGFGHPLYPDGDPRGAALLALAAGLAPDSPAVGEARALAEAGRELLGEHPTIDLGLVALSRALDLPEHTPLALFALGRTIGWIGHAIEEYALNRLIRPRAAYVGEPPAPA